MEPEPSGCCLNGDAARDVENTNFDAAASISLKSALRAELVPLKGGFFDMGARKSRYPADMDAPRRKVRLSPFLLSRTAVPVRLFAAFVKESGYQTVAEREGWSYVFHAQLPDPAAFPDAPDGTPWWRRVDGASWSAPLGPGSDWRDAPDLPAVHLSWFDAKAMADFTGMRLPSEAEWEYAARGGMAHKRFPWGNALVPQSGHRHNVWQGIFPHSNTAEDGYDWACPVDAYPPNGFGLYNMTGNVWEWCEDGFGPLPTGKPVPIDPKGSENETAKIVRGGSFLCHASYCERYQVHSRSSNTPDSSTTHIGMRLAAD